MCEYINTNMKFPCFGFVMNNYTWPPSAFPPQEYPVLVWIWYNCEFTADAPMDTIGSILLKYEEYCEHGDYMHVGLALGWHDSNNLIELEPHEFGCFAGRKSGITGIRQKYPDDHKHISVTARHALYLRVSTEFAREFMTSFGCLQSSAGPKHDSKYTNIVRGGVPYPPLDIILRKCLANAMDMSCIFGMQNTPDVTNQIINIATMCQCAQFSVWPLLNMISVNTGPWGISGVKSEEKARIRELAVVGSALHPSFVYQVLSSIHTFHPIERNTQVKLSGSMVQLDSLQLEDPYGIQVPNLADWARYDLKLSSQ